MNSCFINPAYLSGTLHIPPSKSQTMRAVLLASLAHGTSRIHNLLLSNDTAHMIEACRNFGAKINQITESSVEITGTSGGVQAKAKQVECGNSGIILRFLTAVYALSKEEVVIQGDESVNQRPMGALLSAIAQLGGVATSTELSQQAPVLIKSPIQAGKAELNAHDSQPVSALLIAASQLEGCTELVLHNMGEKPWLKLTVDWLNKLGASLEETLEGYRVHGKSQLKSFEYTVPGDLSTLLFPVVAALITNSQLKLAGVDLSDNQGDKKVLAYLQEMGARIQFNPIENEMTILPSGQLLGGCFDLNECVDALPAMAVLACFCSKPVRLTGVAVAREKECDRLAVITGELIKMGAKIQTEQDTLIVQPSKLHGADLNSSNDHRIAMALYCAGLAATGKSKLVGIDCIEKTFPNFIVKLHKVIC